MFFLSLLQINWCSLGWNWFFCCFLDSYVICSLCVQSFSENFKWGKRDILLVSDVIGWRLFDTFLTTQVLKGLPAMQFSLAPSATCHRLRELCAPLGRHEAFSSAVAYKSNGNDRSLLRVLTPFEYKDPCLHKGLFSDLTRWVVQTIKLVH